MCAKPLIESMALQFPKYLFYTWFYSSRVYHIHAYTHNSSLQIVGISYIDISFRDYSLPLLFFVKRSFFSYYCLQPTLFIALCKIEMMKVRVNPCDMREDSLRENHNELPSPLVARVRIDSRGFYIPCTVSNVFYLYVTLINEGGSSWVPNGRWEIFES